MGGQIWPDMPDTVLGILLKIVSFNPHNNFQRYYYYFQFRDEESQI